jgi:hypothetical protein
MFFVILYPSATTPTHGSHIETPATHKEHDSDHQQHANEGNEPEPLRASPCEKHGAPPVKVFSCFTLIDEIVP